MNLQAELNEASRHNIDPNQPDIRACSPNMHTETDLSQFEQPVQVIERSFVGDWGTFIIIFMLVLLIFFTSNPRA